MRRGLFVTIDGPGGAGKSTITQRLHDLLTSQGHAVYATTQPSDDRLGRIARHHTDTYTGHALACLVAADRYHHLGQIRRHLDAGEIVVCDRYVPSSYVLQRLDGVPAGFIEALNKAADMPDLAVILTADPIVAAERIGRRGAHSRFEHGLGSSHAETSLWADTVERLSSRGWPLLTFDTTETPPGTIAEPIAREIVGRLPRP